MADMAGVRVMRGPDWQDGDKDGGEGHLGTLTQLLGDGRVQVLWDKGEEGTCSAGTEGRFDLRIFDTAQAGVRHPNTRCAECGEVDIYGMLWRCQDCTGCDLCPQCYSDDKHDIRHRFLRIDHYKSEGQPMKKRKISVRMRTMGIFPGAKVTRGRDWVWGDQDGGPGSEGEVEAFENVAPDSSRNLVRVQWSSSKCNSYRLGFHGNVDLKCVEEEVGPFYYRDHLPLLDSKNLPYPLAPKEAFTATTPPIPPTAVAAKPTSPTTAAISSTDTGIATSSCTNTANRSSGNSLSISSSYASATSGQQQQLSETPEADSQDGGAVGGAVAAGEATAVAAAVEELSFVVGDTVVIGVNENQLRDLQEDYGGVADSMIKRIGQKGTVTEITTGIMVRFSSMSYRFNPLALIKVASLKEGDVVRIRRDVTQVKLLNKQVGWSQQMAETCGLVGRVISVDKDKDKDDTVTVTFGHYQTFRFAPACCVPAPGATVDTVGAVGAAVGARRAMGAEGGGGPAAALKPGSTPGGDGRGDVPVLRNDVDDNNVARWNQTTGNDSDSGSEMTNAILRMLGIKSESGSGDGSGSESSDPQVRILFSAISKGERQAVETLLKTKMSLLAKTHHSMTPLMHACHEGQRQIVTMMLDMGADINARNDKGSALLVALGKGEEEIALMLLSRGADPLVQNKKQRSAVHAAAYSNLPEALQMLIAHGADVNAKDCVQDTPLFDAIEKDHVDIVEILLQVPSLNAFELNARGFNMLQLAALKGHARCIETILACERRPPVDDLLLGEYSALHIAANNDHMECVGILVLLGGAKIDIGDGRRQLTPLHLACKRRMINAAEALIELGATVNVIDINGNTPLHLAMGKSLEMDMDDMGVSQDTVIEQRTRLACLLISNGAVVDLEDDQGRSPLAYGHKAVQDNVKQFVQLSEENIRRPNTTDDQTKSSPASVGVTKDKTITEEECFVSKQHDPNLLSALLRGITIQCAGCDAMSDITLQPCGHKSVCRKCCDDFSSCPTCGGNIEDREPDNTDEQEEQETEKAEEEGEEMNKFD